MTAVAGAVVEGYALSHHRRIHRADDFTLGDRLWAWHLLPLQSNISFGIYGDYGLRCYHCGDLVALAAKLRTITVDVTLLISAALVLIRLATSAWFTVSGLRGAYILLEKRGITLAQVSNIVMYHWSRFSNGLRLGYSCP